MLETEPIHGNMFRYDCLDHQYSFQTRNLSFGLRDWKDHGKFGFAGLTRFCETREPKLSMIFPDPQTKTQVAGLKRTLVIQATINKTYF